MTDTATQAGAVEVSNEPVVADYTPGSDDLVNRFSSLLDPQPSESDEAPTEAPEPAGQATEEAPEAEAQPELYTVKIDGEERQVTREQLIASFQKDQAAAKRFEEAATLRKEAQAQQEALNAERAQLRNVIDQYTAQLQQQMQTQQPDWAELIKSDPQKYLEERHKWEQRAVELQQAQTAQAYLQEQQAQLQQQQLVEHLKAQQDLLFDALPTWRDESVATKERAAIKSYLQDMGFPEQKISQIYDYREVVLVDKARKYDELMKAQASATKRVQPLPAKVERPGGGDQNSNDIRSRINKLPRSISTETAAGFFSEMFNTE